MYKIRSAEPGDVGGAVAALGDAFADDPLMSYLFRETPNGVRAGATEFFSILLRARIALGMPAYVLRQAEGMGVAMGYDTSRPAWPAMLETEWRQFEVSLPGFAARLAAYEKICETHQPIEGHFYLGVIGIHPSLQRKGAGKALLDAFCALSRADPQSHGVYLDTSNPSSLQFYYNNGFELRGQGSLDTTPLWCVYKRT
ncbi:GNAT family N-acetyltransferase [Mesorhizobium sp. ASY16-5R]|uniref:GNAT family N-acetyltransferase n=1 Tax=Mesorhizobium sp. ASY16-5R TaxID=3445772 RepID=UPI003FA005EB